MDKRNHHSHVCLYRVGTDLEAKLSTKGMKKPGPPKGTPKVPNSGGSRAGKPNKSTAKAREAIAAFVDENSVRLQGWLDQIAVEDGPKDAFNAFKDLLEYHVPKLARTELTGADGGAVKSETTVVVNFKAVK